MTDGLSELREACARVAESARQVRIEAGATAAYAASLPWERSPLPPDPAAHGLTGTVEELTAFWLTLDAINFGSGWFPTLRKRAGGSGYFTVAAGVRGRFAAKGRWSASELAQIDRTEIAAALGQDPAHELMALFAASLCDLGRHVRDEHGGRFAGVVDSCAGSAVALARMLGGWECFADTSSYDGFDVPFLKRAQIAAADISRAGVPNRPDRDLDRLTIFADNLVPHVLRLDGVLRFDSELVNRIEHGVLIEHGSREEVEIRACALHAVELLVAELPRRCAADLDSLLWHRGQQPGYKASPRHRSRCTAY